VRRATWLVVCVGLLGSLLAWADESVAKVQHRLQSASEVLQELMSAPDKGIPEEVIKSAKCIAVIPHEIEAGLAIGARYGKGVATCRTPNGEWSAPGFFTITGGSWGAQIGIEGVDNVLMIMNQKGMDRLLSSKFTIGADASAAAGPIGRHAAAGTDWKLNTEILSYSRSKGLFAGVTLNGAVVRPDRDAMLAFYAGNATMKDVLTGRIPPPPAARTFLAAVRDAEMQSRKQARE
jgi:SH3 domain-containing YSC84-like protein 1